jgi:hypothetical protein
MGLIAGEGRAALGPDIAHGRGGNAFQIIQGSAARIL